MGLVFAKARAAVKQEAGTSLFAWVAPFARASFPLRRVRASGLRLFAKGFATTGRPHLIHWKCFCHLNDVVCTVFSSQCLTAAGLAYRRA